MNQIKLLNYSKAFVKPDLLLVWVVSIVVVHRLNGTVSIAQDNAIYVMIVENLSMI